MNDNIASVRIVGDASGVKPAIDIAKGEIQGLRPILESISAQFAQLGALMKDSMAESAGATAKMAAEMALLERETAKESISLKAMAASAQEGVKSLQEMREAVMGFGELLLAAFAIEAINEFKNKMAEAAEKINHTAQQFGMAAVEVQRLQAVAMATGVSFDAITRGMGLLDKNLVTASGSSSALGNALKSMGLSAKDGMTQMQLLEKSADKFKDMDDGPKKVALAMLLFGKAGRELIPVLNLGSEGIAEINAKTEEYGAVSQDAADKGMALAESVNEQKIAYTGVSNVMASAFAPLLKDMTDGMNRLIKAFVDSYREGGIVAVIFQTIADFVSVCGAAVDMLAGVFSEVCSAIVDVVRSLLVAIADVFGIQTPKHLNAGTLALNLLKDSFIIAKDLIIICIEVLRGVIVGFVGLIQMNMKMAEDAWHWNWGAIEADWKAGMNRIAADAEATAKRIKAAALEAATAVVAMSQGKAVPSGKTGVPEPKGGGGFDPDLGKTSKGKKAKSDTPSVAEKWKAELAESLLAEKNWGVDEAAFSLKFWESKINQTKKGSKEELAIRLEIAKLKMTLFKEEQQADIAGIKEVQAVRTEALKAEMGLARQSVIDKLAIVEDEAKAGRINNLKATQMRRSLNADLYAIEAEEAKREFQIKIDALNAELKLQHLKPSVIKAINNQILVEQAQFDSKMVLLNAKTNEAFRADDRKVAEARRAQYADMAKQWGNSLGQMLTGQQGFTATLIQGWQSIMGAISNMISRMVTTWLISLVEKEAASKTFNAKQILMDAKAAATGAYKAVVGIPFVGPVLAPIAAAAAFAGVMAFSAEGGMGTVPYDNAPFLLHKNEMVLPAAIASPLRAALASNDNSFGSGVASAGKGGDTHNWHFQSWDSRDVKQFVMGNKQHFVNAAKAAYRDGKR